MGGMIVEVNEFLFFDDEFDMKVCIANMLDKVTVKQSEALRIALKRWDELDKIKGGSDK
jgi:hypothetical protein